MAALLTVPVADYRVCGYSIRSIDTATVEVMQHGIVVATFVDTGEASAIAQADDWLEAEFDVLAGILND